MNKFSTILVWMIVATMATFVCAKSIFAQDDVCSDLEANQALYAKYTDNYSGDITRKNIGQKEMAIAAAKEYVEKYSACEDFKAQVDYLKNAGPSLDKKVNDARERFAKMDRYNRFDEAVKAKNAGEIFASGKDILVFEPDFVDVEIALAAAGFDEASNNKNDKFNNEAISYANSAIKKLNDGAKSQTGEFGLFQYHYKTKENALGWMNYFVGFIKYYRQKNDNGLEYFFSTTQFDSEAKDKSFIYSLIGDKYSDEVRKLSQKIIDVVEANNNKENFESKSLEALERGYTDRAIEAYGKAYLLSKAEKSPKAAINFETLKNLYKFRFETAEVKFTDDVVKSRLESYIDSIKNKKITNPSLEVQPVDSPVEPEQ